MPRTIMNANRPAVAATASPMSWGRFICVRRPMRSFMTETFRLRGRLQDKRQRAV